MLAGSPDDGWVWSGRDGLTMVCGYKRTVIERYRRYSIVGGTHRVVAVHPHVGYVKDVLHINPTTHQIATYANMYVRSIAITDNYVFVSIEKALEVRLLSDFSLVAVWPGRFTSLVALKNDAVAMLDNGLRINTLKDGVWDTRVYAVHAEHALPDHRSVYICYDSHPWCAEHKLPLSHALPENTRTTLCTGPGAHYYVEHHVTYESIYTLWLGQQALCVVRGDCVQLTEHALTYVKDNVVKTLPRVWWFRGNVFLPLCLAGVPTFLLANIKKYIVL